MKHLLIYCGSILATAASMALFTFANAGPAAEWSGIIYVLACLFVVCELRNNAERTFVESALYALALFSVLMVVVIIPLSLVRFFMMK